MPSHDYRQSSTFYSDLTIATVNALVEKKFTAQVANDVAKNICDMILVKFSGEVLYIKKRNVTDKSDSILLDEKQFHDIFISDVNNTLHQHKIDKEKANQITLELYQLIQTLFGGTQVYIPKERKKSSLIRATKIVEEFNGRNITELARKYGFSTTHIYRILRDSRENKNTKKVLA
jgi:Mor family transcriptional regulator